MNATMKNPVDDLRDLILSHPDLILEDPAVMRALITANGQAQGGNVVDLRGVAMERLEARLDRLEDTHRSVIAAAYENLAGTNQVHRAILRMLEPAEFENFLNDLDGEVSEILRVDCMKLVLETSDPDSFPALDKVRGVVKLAAPGFIEDYLTRGRNVPIRQITLRQVMGDESRLFGDGGEWIRSEACLNVDLGHGKQTALLVLGSEDPHHFAPAQGGDLLAFFGGVFERAMRRWLA